MAATTVGAVTFAEFERLPEPAGFRYELRHGELIEVAPPKHEHYLIQRKLRRLLEDSVSNLGVVDIEIGFRALPEHEYREADVAFISQERWDRIPPGGNLEGAPDIVIEVLSRSNTASEIFDKELLCLENGAREFWVVDPVRRHVKISTSAGRAVTWKMGQEIPLWFGGALPVDAIFDS